MVKSDEDVFIWGYPNKSTGDHQGSGGTGNGFKAKAESKAKAQAQAQADEAKSREAGGKS